MHVDCHSVIYANLSAVNEVLEDPRKFGDCLCNNRYFF